LKIGKDYTEEMKALFGPCNHKNGYYYCFNENEKLIKHVEKLWMKAHERTQVSNTRLINKVEARRIVYKRKGQEVNWAMFAQWMIKD